jgi:hypothetical protein
MGALVFLVLENSTGQGSGCLRLDSASLENPNRVDEASMSPKLENCGGDVIYSS